VSGDTPKTVEELLDTLPLTDGEKATRLQLITARDDNLQRLRLDTLMDEIELDREHAAALFKLAETVRNRLIAEDKADKGDAE
jgi:hypothetical protein